MKSVEPSRPAGSEKEWRPCSIVDPYLATSLPEAVSLQGGEGESPGKSAAQSERTRIFLHQLSQTLTSLRGILELALLVVADEQEYKAVIQKSLAQAEGLVQLFKSYRTSEEAESSGVRQDCVELRELVLMAIEQLRPISVSRQITVVVNPAEDCVVRSDAARLLVALRQGLLRAIQRTSTGGQLEVGISASGASACLTIATATQGGEMPLHPRTAEVTERSLTRTFAVDNAKGDLRSVRRAIEVLGGAVSTAATEPSPLFCKICLPLFRHEGS
jgi:light-regulated signal transduction histidine kinase (bacteriophytochrome)